MAEVDLVVIHGRQIEPGEKVIVKVDISLFRVEHDAIAVKNDDSIFLRSFHLWLSPELAKGIREEQRQRTGRKGKRQVRRWEAVHLIAQGDVKAKLNSNQGREILQTIRNAFLS
jgi:hypothetical protein